MLRHPLAPGRLPARIRADELWVDRCPFATRPVEHPRMRRRSGPGPAPTERNQGRSPASRPDVAARTIQGRDSTLGLTCVLPLY
jgi:hypothetical protein